MKRSFHVITIVCGFFLMLALLYQAIASFAFNLSNYPNTPPFDAMSLEITQYLSGKIPSLSSLFNRQEVAHMVDVLHLFQLGKRVSILAAALSLVLLPVAWKILSVPILVNRFRIGMGLFFLFILMLSVWAAVDFNGWFVTMHKVAFTNDLWLFDPNESMLIQMLPTDFFMRAVRSIVSQFLLNTAFVWLLTVLIHKLHKRSVL